MPSSFNLPSSGLSLLRIQKFIPKKWKQSIKESDFRYILQCLLDSSREPKLDPCEVSNEFMVDCLLTTLKDFAGRGQLAKAFTTFALIRGNLSFPPFCDVVVQSLSSLLLCCSDIKSLPAGKQLHAHIISLGLGRHRILVPKIITFYTAFDLLVDAHVVTETSDILHPLPWNLLISSYVKNRWYEEALCAYKQMVNKGIRPDCFTYPSVLKASGEQLNLAFGREVHKSIDASSLGCNLFVQNALVSMYAKCGEVNTARDIFDVMPVKDSVSWNSMIAGYASKGIWSGAFKLFESMRLGGIEVNIITWNTIAGGCLKTGNFTGALDLITQMSATGTCLDPVAVIICLGACCNIGALRLGKEVHGLAVRSWFSNMDNVRNSLINMYARCNDLKRAYVLFQLVKVNNIIAWNSIISGYAHWDMSEEASFLFREMLLSGTEPNYVTIASILPLCARVANLQHGREFHCYIMKREGFEEHLLLWNALVDMYARSGKVLVARKLFNMLKKKDVVTYTSLIAGYGIQGEGRVAVELFEDMVRLQIKPDHVIMVAVLSACSHSGLVVQGQMLFEKMQTIYGITPRLEHYACIADLFGRAGLLKKAEEIIRRMPYKATPEMWATLIGACRIHGNTDIGEWAAEKLLELRPEHSGYYVLIANMYAAAGCWNKLAQVRTYMRDSGVRKSPGRAWVDTGDGFLSFVVEDSSNNQANEMHVILGGMTSQMKDDAFIDYEDSGLEEEVSVG